MALTVRNADRSFILKRKKEADNVQLADPNINMSIQDVQKFYSGQYPELTNCNISGPKMEDGKAIYTFQTIIGDKG